MTNDDYTYISLRLHLILEISLKKNHWNLVYDHLADPPVLYLCQMWVIEVEDVEDADIKRINDE